MRDMEDIQGLVATSETPVPEAAANIQGGFEFDISPDAFKEIGPQLMKTAETERYPAMAPRPVANTMSQSSQHASVIKPDLARMDAFSKYVNFFTDTLKGKDIGRDISDLSYQAISRQLTEDEQIQLDFLNDQLKEANSHAGEYHYNFWESAPAEVVGGVLDLGKGIWANKEYIGAGAAMGAALGAGVGLLTGSPGNVLKGAKLMGTKGAILGVEAAIVVDTYVQTTGQIYNDVNKIIPEASALADDEKRNLAQGGGAVAAAIMLLPIGVVAKQVPWLAKIMTPRSFIKHSLTMQGAKYLELSIAMGKSGLAAGIATGGAEATKIITEEMAKTWDGSETSFTTALKNASDRWQENTERVGKAAGIGFISGAVTTGALRAVGPKQVDPKVVDADFTRMSPDAPMPVGPDLLTAAPDAPPRTDITGPTNNLPSINKGTRAIQLKHAMQQASNITKETGTHKLLPGDMSVIRQQIFEDAGMSHVFVDKEDLNKFANTDDKAKKVENAIGTRGIMDSKSNAPVRIPIDEAMKLVDDHPEFAGLVKADPTGPTADSWAARIVDAETKRQELTAQTQTQLSSAAVKYKYEPMDVSKSTEGKVFYHGSKSLSDLSQVDVTAGEVSNLFGEGLYLTDSPQIASGYAKGTDGRVLITKTKNLKLVDLEKPVPEDVFNVFVKEFEKEGFEVTDEQLKQLRSLPGTVLFKNLRENIGDSDKERKSRNLDLSNKFLKLGYDGFLHQGGKFKEDKHNVIILFDDHEGKPVIGDKLQSAFTKEPRPTDSQIFNESDYLSQPTFTEAMNTVLPAKEILKLNEAQSIARVEVADAIIAEQAKYADKVITLREKQLTLAEEQLQEAKLQSDENINIVEGFLNNTRVYGEITPEIKEKIDKGIPVFSINPLSLSQAGQALYTNNPVLKSRKVFSPTGMNAQDVAAIFGAPNGDALVKILSESPTMKEAIDLEVAKQKVRIEEEAKGNADIDESRLSKAYNNMTKNHIKEMKILKETNWSAVKAGIKRIALPLPTLSELQVKAKTMVGSTPVKLLDSNQWKVGERRSQRAAVEAILKNEVELAFREKENAALNTQLSKETHNAIAKVNKAFSWVTNLSSDRIQAELKDAGVLYSDAIRNILDLYNFDPSQKNQSKVDSYNKYVAEMAKQGKGDFAIPAEVQEWITTQRSANDLTVDQVLYLTDVMRKVLKQARLKNKLLGEYKERGEQMTTEMVAETTHEVALQHPGYDKGASVEPQGDVLRRKKASDIMVGLDAYVQNIQFAVLQLDAGVSNGFFSKMIYQPIEGVGDHAGPYGLNAEVKLQGVMKKKIEKSVKEYGKDFRDAGVTKIFVEELKDNANLNNGKLTKLDLQHILYNMGNGGNKKYVENFGVSSAEMFKILEKYLEERDVKFAQDAVWGSFKSLKPRLEANTKLTQGVDLDFVQPESFTMFGKEWEGGYLPVKLKRDSMIGIVESVLPGGKDFKPSTAAYEGIVRSPHTKERTGSEWLLDIDTSAFSVGLDELIHDLTMSVPVRDVTVYLNDKSVARDIKNIIGIHKYETLVDSIAAITNSIGVETRLYKGSAGMIAKAFGRVEGATIVNWLVANPSTFLVNFMTLPEILNKLGWVSGGKHIGKAALHITNPLNWKNYKEMIDRAIEIDPTLYSYREGLDEFGARTLAKILPTKDIVKNKAGRFVLGKNDQFNEFFLNGVLGTQDAIFKVITIHAAYNQYLAGEAFGHPLEAIQKMTDAERDTNASAYANQISGAVTMRAKPTDRASIQKIPQTKMFARLFNETRSRLNNRLQAGRNMHYDAERMFKKAQEGEYAEAYSAFQDIGSRAFGFLATTMIGLAVYNIAKNKNAFSSEQEDETEPTDPAQIPAWLITRMSTPQGLYSTGKEALGAQIPILRDMLYSAETGYGTSTPLLTGLTNVAATGKYGLIAIADELNWIEAQQELGDREWKQIFGAAGIATNGLPVSAGFKIRDMMTDDNGDIDLPAGDVVGAVIAAIDRFVRKYDKPLTEDEQIMKDFEEDAGVGSTQLQDVVDQAKAIREKLLPPQKGEALEDYEYEIIKYTESKGKWNARPGRGDAFGLYQFIDSTWRRIVDSPEGRKAGLTYSGRLNRNPKQQEAAMRILTNQNAASLRMDNVSVNLDTVYFAHHFGPDRAKEVYLSNEKTKLRKDFFSPIELKNNPQIQDIKTVADMKRYIRKHLDNGVKNYEQLAQN